MARLHYGIAGLFGATALLGACIFTTGNGGDGGMGGTGNTGNTGGTGGSSSTSSGTAGDGGGGGGITDPPCDNAPEVDGDGDGWTGADGDCNDCTEMINPGAYDYDGNAIDEDCNGTDDDTVTECDGSLAMDSNDPLDAVRAMDLCTMQAGDSWGVVSAEYAYVDGTTATATDFDLGHGILSDFGDVVVPKAGQQLFAISSGTARDATDSGWVDPSGFDKSYTTGAAPGFPKESPACPNVTTGEAHDSIHLRIRLKTPTNAKSFRYSVNMYTWEYPDFICSNFNDFVTAIMIPAPANNADTTCDSLPCGNISFDSQGNPLSVNAGFLQVCEAGEHGGKTFDCFLGTEALGGTGFEGHASTGWLQTKAPVEDPGGEIVLEFGAWDSGDGILDTTGLFDAFEWDLEETVVVTDPEL
ncbi:MAG: hypothetical protein JRI68_03260 [Deltaproteobacteria bacterium]|nr:hypothetical protein [Deltaproteobacteria bacterium]